MIFARNLLIRNFSQHKFKPTKFVVRASVDELNFTNEETNKIQWENVRSSLLTSRRNVTKTNLDGIIIGMCFKEKRVDLAKSYFDFMKTQNLEFSDAALGKYLKLIWTTKTIKKEKIDVNDEEIKNICERLLTKYDVLHPDLAENIILGYCVTTKYWRTSLDVVDKIKENVIKTPTSIYFAIISKAIDQDDLKLTWKLIDIIMQDNYAPPTNVVISFFEKYHDNVEEIEKMLNFVSEQNMIFPEDLVEKMNKIFSQKYQSKIMQIKRNGVCWSCSNKLPNVDLSNEEFENLAKNFLEDVFVNRDIFCKTNPEELARFKKFVDKTKPYDCVIDGLNVAYSHGTQTNPKIYSGNILSVVKYFQKRKEKLLVIGRQHMLKWPKQDMDYIRKNCSFFVSHDLSQDDLFILYAALKSGPNTNIFSRDLMRSHSFLLDPECKKLFRRWQQQHQMKLITTLTRYDIVVQDSMHFEMKAHKIGSHWHIPFTSENRKFTYETFDPPSQWICLNLT